MDAAKNSSMTSSAVAASNLSRRAISVVSSSISASSSIAMIRDAWSLPSWISSSAAFCVPVISAAGITTSRQ